MSRSWIAVIVAVAALVPAARPQDELEKLRAQVAELQKENERLQRAVEEAAQEIVRLRSAIKQLASQPANPQPTDPVKGPADPVKVGPENVLKAKIYAVDPKFNFVIINLGAIDGVQAGYRFEIVRYDANNQMKRIAVAEFDKFIGESQAQSKLKIVEGSAGDIKYEDEAIAFRRADVKKPEQPVKGPEPVGGPKKFFIKGTDGDTYWLNYGSQAGAKQTDIVFVYRDNKLRAKLRIDQVDKEWSAAKIVDGSKVGEINVGDELSMKEQKTAAIGTVKFNDERRGMIVDVGSQTHNVRPGTKFEVRRNGRKVGEITLKTVEKAYSFAEPAGDTKREDVQVGDIIESVD
jgi:hypothetical protein